MYSPQYVCACTKNEYTFFKKDIVWSWGRDIKRMRKKCKKKFKNVCVCAWNKNGLNCSKNGRNCKEKKVSNTNNCNTKMEEMN